MVVPSALADSPNVPSLLGVAGAGGLVPGNGAGGEKKEVAAAMAPEAATAVVS